MLVPHTRRGFLLGFFRAALDRKQAPFFYRYFHTLMVLGLSFQFKMFPRSCVHMIFSNHLWLVRENRSLSVRKVDSVA